MNAVIVYKSTYGFTEIYARSLSKELSADLMPAKTATLPLLQKYDTIIYGGGLYAGNVNGFSLITKNFDALADKRLFLFTVGVANARNPESIARIRTSLEPILSPKMQEKIKIFHLRGGLCYSRMSFIHKMMMAMMRHMMRKRPPQQLSEDDKAILSGASQDLDFTDQKTLAPLLEEIRRCSK